MYEENRRIWVRELARIKEKSDKNWIVAFLLSLFLGYFGIDRFYLGYSWSAILKLFTIGGVGIWWAIDLMLLLTGNLRDGDDLLIKPPWAG